MNIGSAKTPLKEREVGSRSVILPLHLVMLRHLTSLESSPQFCCGAAPLFEQSS